MKTPAFAAGSQQYVPIVEGQFICRRLRAGRFFCYGRRDIIVMSDLVKYFPVLTPGAIKRRHKQLSETKKKTTQDVGTQHPARLEKRSAAQLPSLPLPPPANVIPKSRSFITLHRDCRQRANWRNHAAMHASAATPGRPTTLKSRYPLHYQTLKARHSVPHAADDQFDTRSDTGLKEAICKSVGGYKLCREDK